MRVKVLFIEGPNGERIENPEIEKVQRAGPGGMKRCNPLQRRARARRNSSGAELFA